jgi:uncharacterized membrane protein
MKTKLFILTALLAVVIFNACNKDEDSSAGKVTFNKDVKPIFEAKCSPCHLPGAVGDSASINKWNNYTTAKNHIDTILIAVKLNPGESGFMPYNRTKLPSETIAVLDQWLADGLLEK